MIVWVVMTNWPIKCMYTTGVFTSNNSCAVTSPGGILSEYDTLSCLVINASLESDGCGHDSVSTGTMCEGMRSNHIGDVVDACEGDVRVLYDARFAAAALGDGSPCYEVDGMSRCTVADAVSFASYG